MFNSLTEFFQSQLFGIILGSFLTGGFTILCEYLRFNKDEWSK